MPTATFLHTKIQNIYSCVRFKKIQVANNIVYVNDFRCEVNQSIHIWQLWKYTLSLILILAFSDEVSESEMHCRWFNYQIVSKKYLGYIIEVLKYLKFSSSETLLIFFYSNDEQSVFTVTVQLILSFALWWFKSDD